MQRRDRPAHRVLLPGEPVGRVHRDAAERAEQADDGRQVENLVGTETDHAPSARGSSPGCGLVGVGPTPPISGTPYDTRTPS